MDRRGSNRRWQALLFCFLLGSGLALGESTGAALGSVAPPEWVGEWELVTVRGESPDLEIYYSMTEEQIDVVVAKENEDCDVRVIDVGAINGDVIDGVFENSGKSTTFEIEAVDDTSLAFTIVESPVERETGAQVQLCAIEADARVRAGCAEDNH